MKSDTKERAIKIIAQNKKIRRLYEILDRYEAGIVLTGSEMKSLRAGRVSFKDSYVNFFRGEAYLLGLHIARYEQANYLGHEPERDRKLLLHKREIDVLRGKTEQRGLTLVPTLIYFKKARVKVEIGLARGKKVHDRREELKQRTVQREMDREMSRLKK
jgi:SsrA-binding protein